MPECPVTQLQGKLLAEKTFVVVAFGDLPDAKSRPFLPGRLELLSEYFNQRRDVSRSTVKVVPFHLIPKIPMCRGEFIHDVGVLSLEPDEARKHLL
jgi:hypothetical protein